MSEQVWNLLLQIPLAGVVVLVVVVFLKFLDKMLTQFMNFIKEQREANNEALLRLAEEIKEIKEALVKRIDKVEDAILAKKGKKPDNP